MKYAFGPVILAATAIFAYSQPASADMLDDIIADGQLKCGVMLDTPPVGMLSLIHI